MLGLSVIENGKRQPLPRGNCGNLNLEKEKNDEESVFAASHVIDRFVSGRLCRRSKHRRTYPCLGRKRRWLSARSVARNNFADNLHYFAVLQERELL